MVFKQIPHYTRGMNKLTLHSKLIELQGQIISLAEGDKVLSQIRKVLDLRKQGQITISEAGTRIRKAAWKIAEDLRINGLDLSCGSDQSLMQNLPRLLEA